jgi:uncharacterized coiled-coil DUF342 family protein
MPAIGEKAIATELRAIRKELEYIRRHMVDVDMVLSPDEAKRLESAIKEFEEGKTSTLDDIERDRVAV